MNHRQNGQARPKALTRAQILSASASNLKRVDDVWGGTVYIREIKACEFEAFRETIQDAKADNEKMMSYFVALTVCDAEGNRIFKDNETDGVSQLGLPSVMKVFRVAMAHNNLDEADVEELVKN